jgi:hypothetical protein
LGTIVFNNQLSVMQGQLDQMRSDRRAWIKVDEVAAFASPNPVMNIPDGLVFPTKDFPGFLPLRILVRNVGNSPAFNVRVGAWAIFGYAENIPDLAAHERKLCASLDTYPTVPKLVDNTSFAATLFPGDVLSIDEVAVSLPSDSIKKFTDAKTNSFQLWFYGCVRYNLGDSDIPHQTGFAYRVSQIVDAAIPGGKAMEISFQPWVNVPASRIHIEPRPMSVNVAD